MDLKLSDEETAALLRRMIAADRCPLSPRIRVLQAILDRIEPPPVREPSPSSYPIRGWRAAALRAAARGSPTSRVRCTGGRPNTADLRFSASQREMIAHQKAAAGFSTGGRPPKTGFSENPVSPKPPTLAEPGSTRTSPIGGRRRRPTPPSRSDSDVAAYVGDKRGGARASADSGDRTRSRRSLNATAVAFSATAPSSGGTPESRIVVATMFQALGSIDWSSA